MNIYERIQSLEDRMDCLVEGERPAPEATLPTEMSDEEFMTGVKKLGPDWWPTWRDTDGDECRLRLDKTEEFKQQYLPDTGQWDNFPSMPLSALVSVCEVHIQKKLGERKIYVNSLRDDHPGEGYFGVIKHEVDSIRWLKDGDWVLSDADEYPSHRHALLAAARQ